MLIVEWTHFLIFLFFSILLLAKIRRLYDISNVLSSLKLIKKVHVTEERGRKPAFKWTGPENLSLQGQCHLMGFYICVLSIQNTM